MVNLVDDWDLLEEYAGDKLGYYQLLGNDGLVEIRVVSGKIAFKKEFKNPQDPLLTRILNFCTSHRYIAISKTVRDEFFFK
jgi:hypothetical protein